MGEREAHANREKYFKLFGGKAPLCAPYSVEGALPVGVALSSVISHPNYYDAAIKQDWYESADILARLEEAQVFTVEPSWFDGHDKDLDIRHTINKLDTPDVVGIIFHEKLPNTEHAFLVKGPVDRSDQVRLHDLLHPHTTNMSLRQVVERAVPREIHAQHLPQAHILFRGPNYYAYNQER